MRKKIASCRAARGTLCPRKNGVPARKIAITFNQPTFDGIEQLARKRGMPFAAMVRLLIGAGATAILAEHEERDA